MLHGRLPTYSFVLAATAAGASSRSAALATMAAFLTALELTEETKSAATSTEVDLELIEGAAKARRAACLEPLESTDLAATKEPTALTEAEMHEAAILRFCCNTASCLCPRMNEVKKNLEGEG